MHCPCVQQVPIPLFTAVSTWVRTNSARVDHVCAYCNCFSPVQVIRKGQPPCVQVCTEKRQGNKRVTKVAGLEAFLVDPEQVRGGCSRLLVVHNGSTVTMYGV